MQNILKNDVILFIFLVSIFTFKNIFIYKGFPLLPLLGLIFIFIYSYYTKKELFKFFSSIKKVHFILLAFVIILLLINFFISPYKIFFIKSVVKYFTLTLLTLIFVITKRKDFKLFIIIFFTLVELLGIIELFFYKDLKKFLMIIDQFGFKQYPKITGIFIHYNIFGVISSLIGIYCFITLFSENKIIINILSIICLILSFWGIILSTSRNGLLSFLIGIFTFSFLKTNLRTCVISLVLLIIFIFSLIFAIKKNKNFAYRLGRAFPAAIKIYNNNRLKIKDFIPNFNKGLSGRQNIWKRGFQLFKKHYLFGIGIGQFRLENKINRTFNVHNLYFQMLIEGGIFIAIIFYFYIIYFLIKFFPSIYYPIYISILFIICFDNFFDYSFLFNIFTAWLISEIYIYKDEELKI